MKRKRHRSSRDTEQRCRRDRTRRGEIDPDASQIDLARLRLGLLQDNPLKRVGRGRVDRVGGRQQFAEVVDLVHLRGKRVPIDKPNRAKRRPDGNGRRDRPKRTREQKQPTADSSADHRAARRARTTHAAFDSVQEQR